MKRLIFAGALTLAACTAQQATTALSSAPGQLFCSIQTAGGGSFVAALVTSVLSNAAPLAAPLAVIATNAGNDAVNSDCAKAAANVAGAVSGVPVSPPTNPATVATLAIVAPQSPVAKAP